MRPDVDPMRRRVRDLTARAGRMPDGSSPVEVEALLGEGFAQALAGDAWTRVTPDAQLAADIAALRGELRILRGEFERLAAGRRVRRR